MSVDGLTWVIGAGGLLGRHVVRRLEESGSLVLTQNIPWGDPAGTRAALSEGLDALTRLTGDGAWNVVWCAGAGVVATPQEVLERERAVFEAFLANLARRPAAGPRGAFFLASSAGGVYAGSDGPPFSEKTQPRPLAPYGFVKLAMEDALATLARATGMRAFVGRVANLYGPGQNLSKPQGLVSQLCKARFTGQPVSIYVQLDTLRDYLPVADCADMVVAGISGLRRLPATVDDPVVVKILASGRSTSIAGLIEETRRVLRARPHVLLGASRVASAQSRDLRLRSVVWPELDRYARTPLPVGIAATAADVQQRLRARRTIAP